MQLTERQASQIESNTFSLEWPPKSGIVKEFPEVDRDDWFDIETAKQKINPAQADFITELKRLTE